MSTLARQGLTRRALGLVAALVLLALGSLALAPTPLAAVSGSGCIGTHTTTIYFSDASHTTVVGRFTSSCTGVCTGSGSITSFYEIAMLQSICPGHGEP